MKYLLATAAATIALGAHSASLAQDTDSDEEVEVVESEPNGATVTREAIVEEREVLDENGEPVLDEEGNPVFETVETGFVQTVETPSGNVHTLVKEEGSRAVVTHERPEKVARAERPDKPERPERPERPEKPERPERPDRPGRPD